LEGFILANYEMLSSTGSKKPGFFYGYIIVGAAFVVMVLVWGTFYSFGVFFKPVLIEFGWTRAMTSGAYSLSFVLYGLLGIVMGGLTDRFGPRLVVTVCGFLLGLGYLLMSQVSTIWQLYLFYGVMVGIGITAGFVPVASTVARWFVKRRGLMTGVMLAGAGVGQVIVPPVATQLISVYGWRTSYIIVGIIVLVLLVVVAQFLKRDPGQVGLLPDGNSSVEENPPTLEAKGFSIQKAIHTRPFWVLAIMYACYGFFLQATLVHIVPHVTDLGISALLAANILAIIGGVSIAGRVGIGIASDRLGNRPVLVFVFILTGVAFVWLQFTKELWMFYLFAIIFGFAYGGLITLMSPIVAELFGLRVHGAILGVVSLSSAIGGALGPFLAGRVFDLTNSYSVAFIVCAVLSVIALILAVLLRSPRRGSLMGNG